MEDLLEFTEKVDEKFGGQNVPHFLVGQSMGGFLATSLAIEAPERFTGMTLLVPFFGLYNQDIIDKALPIAKMLNWIRPVHQLKLLQSGPCPKHFEHWREDPLELGAYICPHNLL